MAAASDLARIVPPKNFLRPCLLALLHSAAKLRAMHAILDSFLGRCSDTALPDGPHRAA